MTTTSSRHLNVDLLNEYAEWMRYVRNLSPQTCAQYESLLTRYLEHVGDQDVRRVEPEAIQAFTMRERGGRAQGNVGSAATRTRDLAIVSSFYRWMGASDVAVKNPCQLVGRPKVRNRNPRAIDDEAWLTVWEHASMLDRAWLGLGFYSGLRRSEVCNLRPEQLKNGSIVSFVRKGGNEDTFPLDEVLKIWQHKLPRLITIDEFTEPLEWLVSTRPQGESLIPWGGYDVRESAAATRRYGPDVLVEPTAMSVRLRAVLRRAQLNERLFSPHALRHSFVTNMLRAGLPVHMVAKLAAHSSVEITMGYMADTGRMLREWWTQS